MNATSELRTPQLRTWLPSDSADSASGNRPLRVCFLIDELARAGTETQLLALIRHLDRARVLPYLCLLRGDNERSRELEPTDCPVIRLGVGALARLGSIRAALRFRCFLRQERIDAVQVYFPDSTYFGIPLAWLAGVPGRIRTRNNLGHWLTPRHRLLGRLLNSLTTHTIANCRAARDALLGHERPDPERVFVLENGVNLDRFARIPPLRAWDRDAIVTVGVVANLRPVKGIDLLVRAAAKLVGTFPNLRFRVAGDGHQRPELEQLIRHCGLVGKFELCGQVDDVPSFLGAVDVAVLCSHAEGMPNAVLEYMAAGRAIIATNVGAVSDLIENGVHGLVTPAGDEVALAGAIAQLLRAPKLALALGDTARRRAGDHYSREAMIRRFERFYLGMARHGVAKGQLKPRLSTHG